MIYKSTSRFNRVSKNTYDMNMQTRGNTSNRVYMEVLNEGLFKIELQVFPFGEQIKRNLKL